MRSNFLFGGENCMICDVIEQVHLKNDTMWECLTFEWFECSFDESLKMGKWRK